MYWNYYWGQKHIFLILKNIVTPLVDIYDEEKRRIKGIKLSYTVKLTLPKDRDSK